jgi:putative transposase
VTNPLSDALFLKVRDNSNVIIKALYLVFGVNHEELKELLGMWLSESEGGKFYAQIFTELQARRKRVVPGSGLFQ